MFLVGFLVLRYFTDFWAVKKMSKNSCLLFTPKSNHVSGLFACVRDLIPFYWVNYRVPQLDRAGHFRNFPYSHYFKQENKNAAQKMAFLVGGKIKILFDLFSSAIFMP